MEFLSNIAWIAVAIALWGLWLTGRRRPRGGFRRPGTGVQVASLAVLTMILLPVISVSDDLQASHNPAEVERTVLRSDQHLLRPDSAPPAPAALAIVAGWLLPASPGAVACLRPPAYRQSERVAERRVRASRPPPAA